MVQEIISLGLLQLIVMVLFLTLAVWFDLTTYKIPNRWNFVGLSLGCGFHIISEGIRGLFIAIAGILVPVAALFVLYVIGAIGAGDIKLLSALGSFLDCKVMIVVICAMIMTAIYGCFVLLWRTLKGRFLGYTRIHFSLPILFATVGCLIGGVI